MFTVTITLKTHVKLIYYSSGLKNQVKSLISIICILVHIVILNCYSKTRTITKSNLF